MIMIFVKKLDICTMMLYLKFDLLYSKKSSPNNFACAHVSKCNAKCIFGNNY